MRNNFLSLITVALLLSSMGATAAIPRSEAQRRILRLKDSPALAGASWSVFAVDGKGDTLVDINSSVNLIPASNLKLLTTGLSLDALGADFRFRTGFASAGEVVDSVLRSDLVVVCGGDPTVDSSSAELWASALENAGIRRVEGRIVADTTFFDGSSVIGEWLLEDLEEDCGQNYPRYNAALSSLAGKMKADSLVVFGSVPSEARILASVESLSLAEILEYMNRKSDNLYAEALFRMVGKQDTGFACYDSCRVAASRRLESMGVGPVRMVDGSGLSRKNLVSARVLVDFLVKMKDSGNSGIYLASLSRVFDGTMKQRLRNLSDAQRRRFRLKTGSMSGVKCHSGYCGDVVFSIMINNSLASQKELNAVSDEILAVLEAAN